MYKPYPLLKRNTRIAICSFLLLLFFSQAKSQTILFTEGFENNYPPAQWSVQNYTPNSNGWNQYSWDKNSGNYSAVCFPNIANSNAWLFTGPQTMQAGKYYVLSYYIKTETNTLLKITLNTSTEYSGQYKTIRSSFPAPNGSFNLVSDTIVCEVSGTYYIGINNISTSIFGSSSLIDDISFKEMSNYTNCTTVTAGAVSSSVANVCAGTPFTLNASGATFNTLGIRYAWQKSPDGTNWTNITNSYQYQTSLQVIQTDPTFYRLVDTCSLNGNSAISNVIQVTNTSFLNCYCTPATISCFDFRITNITILNSSINNTTGCTAGGYTNYTSLGSATAYRGQNVYIQHSVGNTFNFNYSVGIWVDLNHSGTFEQNEFSVTTFVNTVTAISQYTIPLSALTGDTRLRIRIKYAIASAGPFTYDEFCSTTGAAGEVEDYKLTITDPPNCSGAVSAGTISAPASVCPNNDFAITTANPTIYQAQMKYAWQKSNDGTNWTNINNTSYLINPLVISENASTFYRLTDTCVTSGQSSVSNPLNIVCNSIFTCYCVPASSNCSSFHIDKVTFNTISNISACSANGYANYTSTISTTINNGTNNSISIQVKPVTVTTKYVAVYIDFNRNGLWDGFENVFNGVTTGTVVNGIINVPFNVAGGETLMRVIVSNFSSPSPCNTGGTGEIEDYKVILNLASPVTNKFSYYVKKTATGLNNGSSWTDAFTSLTSALSFAKTADTIKVAKASYTPGTVNTNTFTLKDSLVILGGYPDVGNPTNADRDFKTHQTILSGEIGTAAANDNIRIILKAANIKGVQLDGFIIENGYDPPSNTDGPVSFQNATGSITNTVIRNNYNGYYGAALNAQNSTIRLINNIIENNRSENYSSASSSVLNATANSDLLVVNTVIAKNKGQSLINQHDATIKLLNCTIFKNNGFSNIHDTSTLTVQNSIFYYNGNDLTRDTAELAKDVYSSINISNTITEVYNNASFEFLGRNPKFMDTLSIIGADNKYFSADDGLRLMNPCSPAINTGNNTFIASYSTDITGSTRVKNGIADLGAYEVQETITTQASVLYVNRTATGLNDGSSWTNAFTDLQSAFYRCSDTIKVAKGTYPVSASDPDAYYQLSNNRVVMGGFPNTGNPTNSSFDPVANPTFIDGTVNGTDKSYSLVVAANNDSTSRFIGFELINSSQPGYYTNPQHASVKVAYKSSPYFENIKLDCSKALASNLVLVDVSSNPVFYKSAFYNLFSNQSNLSEIRSVAVTRNSKPTFRKCYFGKDTTAAPLTGSILVGAALNLNGSGGLVDSCTFFRAPNYAISNINSNPIIQNSTFTKTKGRSITNNGSTVLVRNCIFMDTVIYLEENGNAIANLNNSNVTYIKCRFNGSYSYYNGGVCFNENSVASFRSCVFSNLYAFGAGAGILNRGTGHVNLANCIAYNLSHNNGSGTPSGVFLTNEQNSSATFSNCTILGSTGNQKQLIACFGNSTLKFHNSIIWRYGSFAMSTTIENDIYTWNDNNPAVCEIKNSILFKQPNTAMTNTLVGVNPKLINLSIANGSDGLIYTSDDGYKPCTCSPAVNTGNNSLNTENADILELNRIYNGTIDIGAYELQENRTSANTFFVKENAVAGGDGLSWSGAYKDLQKAVLNNCADTIRVAMGTYKPAIVARDSSFNIYSGVTMLGGYPNTGNPLSTDRNPTLYPTIMSGNLGALNDSTDNTGSIIKVHCPDTTVIIDGFIIEKGVANTGSGSNSGAAIQAVGTKNLFIYNCILRNNYSDGGGSGLYSASTNLDVNKTVFTNNTTVYYGGGFEVQDGYSVVNGNAWRPSILFRNSVVAYNTGTGGVITGNGVNVNTGPMRFQNMVFYKNEGMHGGGLRIEDNAFVDIINCTFVKQNVNFVGGGISVLARNPYNQTFFNTYIFNSIMRENTVFGMPSTVLNSDFNWSNGNSNYENIPFQNLDYSAFGSSQTGNAWGNLPGTFIPFRDIDNGPGPDGIWMTPDDGLQPTICAPSIDKGSNQYVTNIPKDILDSARIKNLLADMGAYEVNSFTAKIVASDTAICPGTSVTFTATVQNAGASPFYQWTLNGANVGTNSTTYTSASLVNGDKVRVKVKTQNCTTNDTAYSNIITMTVGNSINPVATIAASDTTICAGGSVTFTAAATNSNAGSVYQWQVNGVNAGTNSNTFTTSSLSNNDLVKVIVTINAACLSTQTATSNTILIHVNPVLTPAVSITGSANPACPGALITYTAAPSNGGSNPSYQWKVNGVNTGTNSSTFSSSSIQNNDVITVVMTSTASCTSTATATSNAITQQLSSPATPAVNISASATNICPGTSVTFTATPTNGGTNPSYQWLVNGVISGTNSNTFTTSSLSNNDQVKAVMASNANCVTAGSATSNTIVIIVGSTTNPSVFISASSTTVCSGGSITFTATPTNGGSSPSYQWQVNGVNAGTNSNTFTTSSLSNNDQVKVIMTSNASCTTSAIATSNTITITISSSVIPSVSIVASATTICSGTSVTFTATPVNGGTPSYQWQVNGVNTGTNSNTFSSSTLTNGAQVKVIMTSSLSCASPASATSNTITITVSSSATPSVSIVASATTICSGTSVTFTATPANGGGTPSYQWQVNGVNTGTNSNTFSSSTLTNGAQVKVIMTSSLSCASPASVTSNTITVTVNAAVTPIILISGTTTVLTGQSTTLSATAFNGGSTPGFQWQDSTFTHTWQNISSATTNTLIYTPAQTGVKVRCILTSNANCASPTTATSNVLLFTVNTVTAVNPVPGTNYGIVYFPNPVQTTLYIDSLRLPDKWQTLEIISIDGKPVGPVKNIANRTTVSVQVEHIPAGTYTAVLRRKNGGAAYLKFIKL